jgi:antitoxin HicB
LGYFSEIRLHGCFAALYYPGENTKACDYEVARGFYIFTDMKIRTYRILLNEEPEGGFTVTVPAPPGCITYGENLTHALEMAREVIEGYIDLLIEEGTAVTYQRGQCLLS